VTDVMALEEAVGVTMVSDLWQIGCPLGCRLSFRGGCPFTLPAFRVPRTDFNE
jgi:hypothetical protein